MAQIKELRNKNVRKTSLVNWGTQKSQNTPLIFWQSEIENICRNSQFFPIAHTVFIIYKMEKNEVVSIIFQAEGHTSPRPKGFTRVGVLLFVCNMGQN